MSPKLHEFVVVLERDGPHTPWGIRLVGGADLKTSLIITKVQLGSPSYGEVLRGDVISKIGEYDARDLRHEDAQMLFKTAGNEIRLVVQRDNKIAYSQQALSNDSSRCSSTVPSPISPNNFLSPTNQIQNSHRALSPGLSQDQAIDLLPHTVFPTNPSMRPCSRESGFSPMPTRDHQQETEEEKAYIVNQDHKMQNTYITFKNGRPVYYRDVPDMNEPIQYQPYRTTPLVLPGAKVKKDTPTTESYLRYYPNPAVRAPPGAHEYQDVLMKQRVADTMLHRVVGEDADTGRVFHKQFNSPIGLYSDRNIENTIRQTVPLKGSPLYRDLPSKLEGHKGTVVYDPSRSETFRALQEEGYGDPNYIQEVTNPVQPKVFHPNRMVPGKKPISPRPTTSPSIHVTYTDDEPIRQSGSFNRLMHSVLGATDY